MNGFSPEQQRGMYVHEICDELVEAEVPLLLVEGLREYADGLLRPRVVDHPEYIYVRD